MVNKSTIDSKRYRIGCEAREGRREREIYIMFPTSTNCPQVPGEAYRCFAISETTINTEKFEVSAWARRLALLQELRYISVPVDAALTQTEG